MSDVQRAGVSVTPKTGQCDKSASPASTSNITAETFNKILMTVSVAKIKSVKRIKVCLNHIMFISKYFCLE